jgi:PD-(D/E)XK endonuclease
MEHPKDIGERSQLAVMIALDHVGYAVFAPLGENTRADLVIDEGERLARVQCKTGRLRDGAIRFKSCSSYAHHPNPKILKRDYAGEVDYFGIYCPETQRVYLIPIEDVPTHWECRLRVDPPRNRQRSRVRFAARYEIAEVRISATAALAGRLGAAGSCA